MWICDESITYVDPSVSQVVDEVAADARLGSSVVIGVGTVLGSEAFDSEAADVGRGLVSLCGES